MKSMTRPLLHLAAMVLALGLMAVGAYGIVPPMGDASSSSGESGSIIALPTTPPEVDDTPIQPQPEPEPEPEPQPPPQSTAEEQSPAAADSQSPAAEAGSLWSIDNILTTETVLLLGLVVWYGFTLAGIAGGRCGRRSRPAHPNI